MKQNGMKLARQFRILVLRVIVVVSCLLSFSSYIYAQEDSTITQIDTEKIEKLVQKEVKEKLEWVYWIGGFSIGAVSLYGLYLWFFGVKKIADKQIEEKADALISEKLSEKTGVKLETLRALLSEAGKKIEVKSKPILVIAKNMKRKEELTDFLEDGGFSNFSFETTSNLPVDTNGVYLVLIDNEADLLSDEEVTQLFEALEGQVKIAYLGRQVDTGIFNTFKKHVKFTNNRSYLVDNLTNALSN